MHRIQGARLIESRHSCPLPVMAWRVPFTKASLTPSKSLAIHSEPVAKGSLTLSYVLSVAQLVPAYLPASNNCARLLLF